MSDGGVEQPLASPGSAKYDTVQISLTPWMICAFIKVQLIYVAVDTYTPYWSSPLFSLKGIQFPIWEHRPSGESLMDIFMLLPEMC